MARAVAVISRSGRSTLPATSQPRATEAMAVMPNAIADTTAAVECLVMCGNPETAGWCPVAG